jgi:hypoxanthine phosphoribosyltransferase
MESIKIKDKLFKLSITAEQINSAVRDIATKINNEYEGKDPVFLVILNGAFMFASDLFKELNIQCEVSFVKLASYAGIKSTEVVKTIIGLNEDIRGKSIIIVEDIVDTGNTIEDITESLKKLCPEDVKICTMLFKPEAYKKKIKIDYIGVEIPNDFIVGHGLDYDGFGRNLTDIYKIVE